MIIGNIILAILFFICGYMIRPYADELREISEIEKSLKDFVNEGKDDEHIQ